MALALLTSPLVSVANITLGALNGVQRVACAEFYGQQKSSTDCVAAIRQMPSGDTPVTYTFGGYDRATRLPQYYQSGQFPISPKPYHVRLYTLSEPIRRSK